MTDPTAVPPFSPTCSWFGDHTLRLSFGITNSPETRSRVRTAFDALQSLQDPEIADLTPAYTTLLVHFHIHAATAASIEKCQKLVEQALANSNRATAQQPSRPAINIPVCYEGDCAPDLQTIATHSGLSANAVITLHSSTEYEVAFIGFSPGFPYLTGLSEKLTTPRLEKPRVRVPAGSIGIAGDQTGIYPRATAGGWQLIGRTPFNLFDPIRSNPSLLSPGDRVRFLSIPRSEFDMIAAQSLPDRKS